MCLFFFFSGWKEDEGCFSKPSGGFLNSLHFELLFCSLKVTTENKGRKQMCGDSLKLFDEALRSFVGLQSIE